MEVVDLHCDLLAYLATDPSRTAFDPNCRCSIDQLKEGGVQLQTLAISSITGKESLSFGLKQIELFLNLSKTYPSYFHEANTLAAFENASSFCTEEEPLENVFVRLKNLLPKMRVLYISLTWNGENRFGGGCGSFVGLKKDGKKLLLFLSSYKIAIDLSHTSDLLAVDILNFIEKENLPLKVMASHSNFRSLDPHLRNLPDDIAKEIFRRKGIVGLVFYKKFLKDPDFLCEHIAYGIKLGGEKLLAFGADFFCMEDFHFPEPGGFFKKMENASCYPFVLENIEKKMGLPSQILKGIASKNVLQFMEK